MNIIDRLARWYAASRFGSSRLGPNFYSRRKPIYDALPESEQLTWRMFDARERVRAILILLGLLPAGVLGITDVLFDGDQVNNGIIGALAAAGYVLLFFLTASQWLDGRAFRRRFAEKLATIPSEPIPAGRWYVRLFWWLTLVGPSYLWVWPTESQRERSTPYALAFARLTDDQQRQMLATALRWHLIGVGISLLFWLPIAWFLTDPDVLPYKFGLFAPLLLILAAFAVITGSWEIWKRRVWARRILERQPA